MSELSIIQKTYDLIKCDRQMIPTPKTDGCNHFCYLSDRQLTLACTGRTDNLWLCFSAICRR